MVFLLVPDGNPGIPLAFVNIVRMASWYERWMYDWEMRLTSVDNNRVVRPLEWGMDWAREWPCQDAVATIEATDPETFFCDFNRRIIQNSDEFYSYTAPTDFRLERREVQVFSTREVPDPKLDEAVRGTFADFLRFTSPVRTQHPENDLANARWFPSEGKKAVVLLPHWNSDAISYVSLCRVLNRLGIGVLRLSMPYHDIRMPREISRADYAVSANIGRTLNAVRQGVLDIRCCYDWLEKQGYEQLGIVGTSLGSCYAFIAAAHDPRIRVAAFNHASTYFSDVVWHGQSTRHIREGLETAIDLERLRKLWLAISPMSYFDQFSRWPKKSLIIYAKYDMTFLPEFSRQVIAEFARHNLDHKVVALPCGHYTTGETPYKYIDGYHLAAFLRKAFDRVPYVSPALAVAE
ncbi:MAG TPA: abhydrolase domain-containing 18 [Terriglobales bacterium]|jgi:pimeloyl-ACP methyl ester carboxylesterase|nr:abhydrolase domain-containing 18 [Terriglobales bacterium]